MTQGEMWPGLEKVCSGAAVVAAPPHPTYLDLEHLGDTDEVCRLVTRAERRCRVGRMRRDAVERWQLLAVNLRAWVEDEGLDPTRLCVFAASVWRWSKATRIQLMNDRVVATRAYLGGGRRRPGLVWAAYQPHRDRDVRRFESSALSDVMDEEPSWRWELSRHELVREVQAKAQAALEEWFGHKHF